MTKMQIVLGLNQGRVNCDECSGIGGFWQLSVFPLHTNYLKTRIMRLKCKIDMRCESIRLRCVGCLVAGPQYPWHTIDSSCGPWASPVRGARWMAAIFRTPSTNLFLAEAKWRDWAIAHRHYLLVGVTLSVRPLRWPLPPPCTSMTASKWVPLSGSQLTARTIWIWSMRLHHHRCFLWG